MLLYRAPEFASFYLTLERTERLPDIFFLVTAHIFASISLLLPELLSLLPLL